MSLIIDATKAAERERERRLAENGGAAPLLIPIRSVPNPEFSWLRAGMFGIAGVGLLAAGWIAFVKTRDTRQQPSALLSPPLIGDVAAIPRVDSAVVPRDEPSASVAMTSIPASRPSPARPSGSSVRPAGVVARADSMQESRDAATATPQGALAEAAPSSPERAAASPGRLRIAVDAREMNLSQLFAMGVAAHRAGDLAQARSAYERVLAGDGNHVDALNNMGVLLSATREFDRAETLLRRAVRLSPRNAAAWNNLGTALAQRGQSGDAIAAFQHALGIEPQHLSARVSLAQQYLAIGSVADSRRLLEEVLASNPGAPEAYYTLGQVHELERNWAGAIAAYTSFVRVAPGRLQEHAEFVRRRIDALSARVR